MKYFGHEEYVSHEELVEILGQWEPGKSLTLPCAYREKNATPKRAERLKVRWKLKIAIANDKASTVPPEFDAGRVRNISATGIGIITQWPISTGDRCVCLLYPPTHDLPMTALGQGIWQKPVGNVFAAGVQFLKWQHAGELDLALEIAEKENGLEHPSGNR